MQAYYFHGLNSDLRSRKAKILREYFDGYLIQLHEIDLNIPSKKEYKLESIIESSRKFVEYSSTINERIILIGSSFGCYVIMNLYSYLTNNKIFKIIFLSPVFDLTKASLFQGQFKTGNTINYYLSSYDQVAPIRIKDDMNFFEPQFFSKAPLLIVHGIQDEVINFNYSQQYVDRINSNQVVLHLVNSNHRLTKNFESILAIIDEFLFGFDGHKVITFDFSNKLFNDWSKHIFNVLRSSYGEMYFGDSYHYEKIVNRQSRLFLVFDKSIEGTKNLVACSYIEPSGKHLAMGVLPEYQRLGIAKTIFLFSFQFVKFQYAETSVENEPMIKTLKEVGFREVNIIRHVKEYLGIAKSSLIENYFFTKNGLIYRRKSTILAEENNFKLLVRER